MKNTNAVSEHDIRLFFDAADRLLQAALQQGETAEQATSALIQAAAVHKRQMRDVGESVISAIDAAASTTAQESARLLADHFREADRTADRAAERYKRACRSLGWKNWLWFVAAQGALCTVAIVLIVTLIPSLDEIHARRTALAQAKEVAERIPLSWRECTVEGKATRCFRTDEKAGVLRLDDGSIWRVPWSKQ